MNEHTPGPWNCQALAGEHDFAIYNAEDGSDIALARNFHEPNARLIAAAPDLLEALKKMDALMDMLWEAVPWGKTFNLDIAMLNEYPTIAKRAIAKATTHGEKRR